MSPPIRIGEQIGARVGVSPARAGKHVASVYGGLQMLKHAKGVGGKINAAVFPHNVTLPGFVDNFAGRIVVRLVAILLIGQPVARGEQRPTRRGRFKGDVSEHMG